MRTFTKEEIQKILQSHSDWQMDKGGACADFSNADLREADFTNANLRKAILRNAILEGANFENAILEDADLKNADFEEAILANADLRYADLRNADLRSANLEKAILTSADLINANLKNANLKNADLRYAILRNANLTNAKSLVKVMGFEPGNIYWKRFEEGLKNNDFQFKAGLNVLREGEVFASDERVLCSFPGFHFASRSWCAENYPYRPLEARIRIPLDAQINEPWATDGKASTDKIDILQVFDVKTGEDVTERYR